MVSKFIDVYDSDLATQLTDYLNTMYEPGQHTEMKDRFRGYLPVVVDVETGGFNEQTDALLEIAAVLVDFDESGKLVCTDSYSTHVHPFEGANLEPKSMEINGIDPDNPLRAARAEREALNTYLHPYVRRSKMLAATALF